MMSQYSAPSFVSISWMSKSSMATSLNPASVMMATSRFGSARPKIPGEPGGGAGTSRCFFRTIMGNDAKGTRGGSAQVLAHMRAPGLRAAKARRKQPTGSGMNIRPQRQVAASKLFASNSIASPST
jgi:hypothetical protein